MMSSKNAYIAFPIFFILLSHFSVPVHSGAVYPVHTKGSGCGSAVKIIAILVTSMVGVCLPLVTRSVKALNLFVVVKAFAAGIILGTGFIHVLSDSFEMLSSSCSPENFLFPSNVGRNGARRLHAFSRRSTSL